MCIDTVQVWTWVSVEHYSAHTPWGRSSGQPPANSQILQPTVSVGAFPEFVLLAGTFASFSGACWQLLLILPSTPWTCFSPVGPNKDKVAGHKCTLQNLTTSLLVSSSFGVRSSRGCRTSFKYAFALSAWRRTRVESWLPRSTHAHFTVLGR